MSVDGSFDDDRHYSFQFCGHCLGEWLPDGCLLFADPEKPIEPYDIVSIVLKRDTGPWADLMNSHGGGFFGVCKIYLGSYESPAGIVHIVGQLVPPCAALIPEDAIEALHSVVLASGSTEMTERDRQGLALIRPFCRAAAARPPINPTWMDDLLRVAEAEAA